MKCVLCLSRSNFKQQHVAAEIFHSMKYRENGKNDFVHALCMCCAMCCTVMRWYLCCGGWCSKFKRWISNYYTHIFNQIIVFAQQISQTFQWSIYRIEFVMVERHLRASRHISFFFFVIFSSPNKKWENWANRKSVKIIVDWIAFYLLVAGLDFRRHIFHLPCF